MSHPVWDEWIEIGEDWMSEPGNKGLIPFGMSGLKSGIESQVKN